MARRISAREARRLLTEIEASSRYEPILAFGGASQLASVLRQQFLRGGAEPGAVRVGDPECADLYVHVLAGEAGDDDVAILRRARRARVPAIVVSAGPVDDDAAIPYVLATDIVRIAPGRGFPLEEIARAIAVRLNEDGARLAARVPLLRPAVCQRLVTAFAQRNGLIAAAFWIPGADLPMLALNQLRLVLRLAQAHGDERGGRRLPELVATLGAGFGLRALARYQARLLPWGAWAVKAGVAYAGTRVIGEAELKLRERESVTRPRVGASPAWR